MSSVTWKENRLFQHVGKHDEELGYVDFDQKFDNLCFMVEGHVWCAGVARRIHTGRRISFDGCRQTEGRVIVVRVHFSLHMDEERCQTGNHTSFG